MVPVRPVLSGRPPGVPAAARHPSVRREASALWPEAWGTSLATPKVRVLPALTGGTITAAVPSPEERSQGVPP
jgi:hypothetical protein